MRRFVSALISVLVLSVMTVQAQNSPEEKFNMTMYAVTQMYVDSIDKSKFVDTEVARLLQSLDPFSEYLPPATAQANEIAIKGISATQQPKVSVSSQSYAKPSFATSGKSTIKSYYMVDKTTGYVCLTMFAEATIADFHNAIAELKKKGMRHLILDLRNNAGGLFDVAVALADEFLDGDKVIVSTRGAHVPSEVFCAKNKGVMEKGRLVLLVDGQTKSAAEIFAAAIRDWDRGILVGKSTFGKGLIQETLPFSDGSALRITVARYLTPSGMSIQKPYKGQTFADSTKVWQSLQNHRTLQCHGGVSADVDVTPNQDYMTNWYTLITYSGVQTAVSRKYLADRKDQLLKEYPSSDKFIKGYDVEEEVLKAVCETAESAGIPTDQADYIKTEPRLKEQMKAVICSQLYQDNNLYYKLFNANNAAVKRALEIIGSKEYDQILNVQ